MKKKYCISWLIKISEIIGLVTLLHTLGGVPGSSLSSDQLDSQALVLAASGIGFLTVILAATTSTAL